MRVVTLLSLAGCEGIVFRILIVHFVIQIVRVGSAACVGRIRAAVFLEVIIFTVVRAGRWGVSSGAESGAGVRSSFLKLRRRGRGLWILRWRH